MPGSDAQYSGGGPYDLLRQATQAMMSRYVHNFIASKGLRCSRLSRGFTFLPVILKLYLQLAVSQGTFEGL